MATTTTELLMQIRDSLDEVTPAQWSQQSLRRWINDGMKDMARVTRHIRDRVVVTMVSGTAEYVLAENILEIELAYYLPGDGRYIPLQPRQYEGMDAIWGQQQNQQGGWPILYTVWGYSPNLKLRLYPVPPTNGHTVSLSVIRYPNLIPIDGSADSTVIDFPEAWSESLVQYAEARALRKDRDPRWQESMTRYNEIRDQLVVMGDYLNVPREVVMDPYVGAMPRWLVDPGY
jgi:hypothetical protein